MSKKFNEKKCEINKTKHRNKVPLINFKVISFENCTYDTVDKAAGKSHRMPFLGSSEAKMALVVGYSGISAKHVLLHQEKRIDENNKTYFVEYILVVLRKNFKLRKKKTVLLRGEKEYC